ncbi:DNA polymerase III subunit [Egicoccus halophilus]|uniref:DNA polymerase III subunit delta' n=1 Tax=Egicoccus halophilus TaxID=1670830 RepID=A0A8J3ESM4_9ACTN|nr:DNA polymerase III subunit delta' C-terminal domain-containing protein [Egicoccus halophilus]GGI07722.1 DNA polymerase III subunit delta' [Egicoccus halophilus]
MTTWDDVLGQPAAVTALRAALRADEVAHAWLLVGPRGVGQRELTRALAATLNCERPPAPDAACGTCSSCERIGRGTSPVQTDLEPEGSSHLVEGVRGEWMPLATRTLTEGRRRVLRVVAADRMNEAAQNAFLKILEEPPPSVVWVLDVEDEGALLETVVSRCRRLDLVPWGPEAMQVLAERLDVPPEQRTALARAALGSPERLRDLADPQVADARWQHLALLDRLATGGPGQVVPAAKESVAWARSRIAPLKERHQAELARLEEAFGVEGNKGWPPGVRQRLTRRFERLERQEQRRALDLLLDDLASYLRDLLAAQAGASTDVLINIDHEAAIRRDAQRLGPAELVSALHAVSRCREALDRNGNPELQLERLLLQLALPLFAVANRERVS